MSGFHYPGVPVTALLYSLWPLFALIVGGYALRRWDFPGEAFWPAAERLNYFILFPALLFSNLATAPLDDPGLARQALAVLLGLGVAWLALLLCKRWRGWDAGRFGAIAQGVLRFNTYLGLAAVGSLYGKPGLTLAALMLALMVPTVNVMSVWALTAERGISLRALLLPILKNPLILACLAGALVNLAGVGLAQQSWPAEIRERFVEDIAQAALIVGVGSFPQDELEQRFAPLRGATDLPFLCANPDRVVVSGGRTVYGAGMLAELFSEEGGQVSWYGKPDPAAFRIAQRQLEARGARHILFVGDSLVTDVPGALAARIDTLWLGATGIHREALGAEFNGALDEERVRSLLHGYPIRPHFAAPGLV